MLLIIIRVVGLKTNSENEFASNNVEQYRFELKNLV